MTALSDEQLLDGIQRALEARDMDAAAALIRRLAVQNPDAAQVIFDGLQLFERAETPGEIRYQEAVRVGIREQMARLRGLLDRDDRDALTDWEVLELAADALTALADAERRGEQRVARAMAALAEYAEQYNEPLDAESIRRTLAIVTTEAGRKASEAS